MLTLTVKSGELYDDTAQRFIKVGDTTLVLEHSLVSLSKWEKKFHKPFLSNAPKTQEETLFYIECMTVSQNVNPLVYSLLSKSDMEVISSYIQDPMTATKFPREFEEEGRRNSETVTSELIYYWMITYQIPFDCQRWHLNSLLTLIKVCSFKNKPGKKLSAKEVASRNAAINAARKKQLGTTG